MPALAKGKTYGRITDQNNKGVADLKIELWDDDDPDADDRMGVTHTDANGNYQFRYSGGWDLRVPGSTSFRPDIYVTASIKNRNGDWCQVTRSKTYTNYKLNNDKKIDLQVSISSRKQQRIPFDVARYAFQFPNSFEFESPFPQFPGTVDMGFCGGMCAAALHRYRHQCATPDPSQTTTPRSGPLYDELFRRQLLTLSELDVRQIWDWQRSPDVPHAHTPDSIRFKQKGQWQVLQSQYIDKSRPAILCLIRQEGYVAEIWKNHQVLAFGYDYESAPRNLTVEVYDPDDEHGSDFLHLCLSGGRLGAHQVDSSGKRKNFRGFLVMSTTDKASSDHM